MASMELRDAYNYIKSGDKATARNILQPYVKDHPKDANGWWLLAHAVSDTSQRRSNLERVLKLDPDFGPAQRELHQLDIDDDDFWISTPDAKPKNSDKKSGGSKRETVIGMVLIGVGVTVFACVGIVYALSRAGGAIVQDIAQNVTVEYSSSGGSGSGAFSGHTWDVIQEGSIDAGQTVNDNVDTFDDDGWTLQGRAGQSITIEANATDSQLDTQLYLYAPDGRLLDENDDIDFMNDNTDSRLSLTLPDDGTYGIVVSAFGSGGPYRLSVR